MEYWSIRRLEREQATLRERIANAEQTLTTAQESRVGLVGESKIEGDELYEAREKLFAEIQFLNEAREEIMTEAHATKRRHSALTMKVKVLQEEGDDGSERVTQSRSSLAALRENFTETKRKKTSTKNQGTNQSQKKSQR